MFADAHLFTLAAALLAGYLIGSIPFGLILTRLAGAGDIRAIGSGNIGATNVLRTGRKALAAGTLACDILKGTLAVLLAIGLAGRGAGLAAGFGAFVGHLFPLWLGFKGGKGVATFLGVLAALALPALLGVGAIWLAVAALTRYASLASLIACASAPPLLWFFGYASEAGVFVVMAALVFGMHHGNIRRLLAGTESRIGQKTAAASDA